MTIIENAGRGACTEDVLKRFSTLIVQSEKQKRQYDDIEKVNLHACEFLANMGDLVILLSHVVSSQHSLWLFMGCTFEIL